MSKFIYVIRVDENANDSNFNVMQLVKANKPEGFDISDYDGRNVGVEEFDVVEVIYDHEIESLEDGDHNVVSHVIESRKPAKALYRSIKKDYLEPIREAKKLAKENKVARRSLLSQDVEAGVKEVLRVAEFSSLEDETVIKAVISALKKELKNSIPSE